MIAHIIASKSTCDDVTQNLISSEHPSFFDLGKAGIKYRKGPERRLNPP
jgi:hypothetical protein